MTLICNTLQNATLTEDLPFFFRPLTQIQLFVLPQVHLLPLEVLFDIKVCNTPNWYFLSTSTFIFPAGKRMLYFFFLVWVSIISPLYVKWSILEALEGIPSLSLRVLRFSHRNLQFLWISSTRVESLFIRSDRCVRHFTAQVNAHTIAQLWLCN